MISEIRPNCADKNTQVFFTWQLEKKNVQSKCFMNLIYGLHHTSCFVFEHETLYTIRALAVFDFITIRNLAI